MIWNGEHTPRLTKAFIAVGIGFATVIAGGGASTALGLDWVLWVCLVAGFLFAGMGCLEAVLVYYAGHERLQDTETRRLKAEAEVIIALNGADQQTRAILGIKYPHYNYRWDGQETGLCWQDTDVPREIFWRFLRESDKTNTVPQRNWKMESVQMHDYWITIYQKLVEMDMVIANSSTGPYSEFWHGNSYNRAWAMWPLVVEEME